MGKIFIGSAAALAVAASFSASVPALANGDKAAMVVRADGVCDFRSNGFDGTDFEGIGNAQYVDSNANSTGPAVLICKGELTAGPELKSAVHLRDFPCWTPFQSTNDSQTVISPSGKWTTICKFRD